MKVIITFSINSKFKSEVEALSVQIQSIETVAEYNIATSENIEDEGSEYMIDHDPLINERFSPMENDYDEKEYIEQIPVNDIVKVEIKEEPKWDNEEDFKNGGQKKQNEVDVKTEGTHNCKIKFNCLKCEKQDDDKSAMIDHMEQDHSYRFRKCNECLMLFTSQYQFDVHYLITHNTNSRYRQLQCKICKSYFQSKGTLRLHFNIEHYKFESFHCGLCEYFTFGDLTEHMKHTHNVENITYLRSGETCKEANKYYHCFGCKDKYSHLEEAKEHMNTCGRAKFVECKDCNEVCRNGKHLSIHQQLYHEHEESFREEKEKGYLCKLCDKKFKAKNNYKFHFEGEHNKLKSTQCPWCHKYIFKIFSHHMFRKHSEIKKEQMKPKIVEENQPAIEEEFIPKISLEDINNERFTSNFKYNCFFCKHSSENESEVIQHIKQNHPNMFVSCSNCDSLFRDQNHLSTHHRLEHDGNVDQIWKCDVCDKILADSLKLSNHFLYIHNKFKSAYCPFCSFSTFRFQEIKWHLKRVHVHTESRSDLICQYHCLSCMKIFPSEVLCNEHIVQEHKDFIQCLTCQKPFKDQQQIEAHRRIEHSTGDKEDLACNICNESFDVTSGLSDHFHSKHHKIKSFRCNACMFSSENEQTVLEHVEYNHKSLHCDVCETVVHNSKYNIWHVHNGYHKKYDSMACHFCDYKGTLDPLRAHILAKHGEALCVKCFEFIEKSKLKEHSETCVKTIFGCHKCKESFNTNEEKLVHFDFVHKTESAIFKCDICSRSFVSRRTYHTHMKKHSTIKEQCTYCGIVLPNSELEVHLELTHGEVKKAKCKFCGEEFSGRTKYSQLEEHVASYHIAAAETFQCEQCGKWLPSKPMLHKHMMAAHKKDDTPEALTCPYCQKEYSTKYVLKDHIKQIHLKIETKKEFQCEECDWAFDKLGKLRQHVNARHRKIKPYNCTYCEKSFSKRKTLTNHINWVHLKIRENCPICGVSVVDLTGHIRGVHEKKVTPRRKKIKQDFDEESIYI